MIKVTITIPIKRGLKRKLEITQLNIRHELQLLSRLKGD